MVIKEKHNYYFLKNVSLNLLWEFFQTDLKTFIVQHRKVVLLLLLLLLITIEHFNKADEKKNRLFTIETFFLFVFISFMIC